MPERIPRPCRPKLSLLVALATICSSASASEKAPLSYQVRWNSSGVQLQAAGSPVRVELLPSLLVAYRNPGKQRNIPPAGILRAWFTDIRGRTLAGNAWEVDARAQVPGVSYLLRLSHSPEEPLIRFRLEILYRRQLLVHQEVLRWRFGSAGEMAMLDRAYRWSRVNRDSFSGPLTPHLVRIDSADPPLWIAGESGVQGLWVRPEKGRGALVDLEIDHPANHPFRIYRGCVLVPNRRLLKIRMDSTSRLAGDRAVAEGAWLLGTARPALVGRYPRGAQAAMVFTDHADPSSAAKLEAFAFGRTGALRAGEVGEQYPGFVNRGLAYTKTIFLRQAGRYEAQFEDPAYRRVLDALVKQGTEIGVHSISGFRDRPGPADQLLAEFRKAFPGRTWIDHQPDTNCEAISNLGWNPFSRWFMLNKLVKYGFKYLANAEDLALRKPSLNALVPGWPGTRRSLIYPSVRMFTSGSEPFVQFSTSWMFVKRERLLDWFSPQALDRFEKERGLLIGHVYFDTYDTRKKIPRRQRLLEADGNGGFTLHKDVDELFVRLARRAAAGRLWITGIEALADHLLGAMECRTTWLTGGKIRLRGSPRRSLKDVTLILPGECESVRVDGKAPGGSRRTEYGLEAWFDLESGQVREVELLDRQGRPVDLVQPVSVILLKGRA